VQSSPEDAISNPHIVTALYEEIRVKLGKPKEAPPTKAVSQPTTTAVSSAASSGALNLPNISDEDMQKGMSTLKTMAPDTRKQYFDMLKNTDPRLLTQIFKSQGLNMEPENIAKMRDAISEDSLDQLTGMFGDSSGSGPTAESLQAAAANPGMRKMISEMLSKQIGRPASELEGYINVIQRCVGFFLATKRLYKQVAGGWKKYLWLGGIIGAVVYNYL
jgi:hypothetical protein